MSAAESCFSALKPSFSGAVRLYVTDSVQQANCCTCVLLMSEQQRAEARVYMNSKSTNETIMCFYEKSSKNNTKLFKSVFFSLRRKPILRFSNQHCHPFPAYSLIDYE